MGELEHKYEVKIKTEEDKQKLSDDVKSMLKSSGMMDEKGKLKIKGVSPKMLKKMKQEYVDCPVYKNKITFIQCFICPNFQSRIMGNVLCKGDPLPDSSKTESKSTTKKSSTKSSTKKDKKIQKKHK